MSLQCDLNLEDSKQIFSLVSPAHHLTKFYLKKRKVQQIKTYHPDKHSFCILKFRCDLDLESTIHFLFFLTKHLTLMIMYHQTKFGCKRIGVQKIYYKLPFLIIKAITVIIANRSFGMTLQLRLTHQDTKFGNKMFSD